MRPGPINRWMSIALASTSLALQACEGPPSTYNDVVTTPDGIRTGQRLVSLPPSETAWQFHTHDDLDEDTRGDLAVSPDGTELFLAFLRRTSSDNCELVVRSGLVVSSEEQSWSSSFTRIVVPPNPDIDPFDFCRSGSMRIKHLKDGLYGIVWAVEEKLHSALFDSNTSDLVLNDVISGFKATNLANTKMSLVYFNDEVLLHWSQQEPDRIMTKRGTLTAAGISFGQFSTFTPVPHETMSDVIAHDGALFVATTDGEFSRLYSTSINDGTNWVEQTSCESWLGLHYKLLYVDSEGNKRALEATPPHSPHAELLRNFTDCSSTEFSLPIRAGIVTYFAGE